MFDSNLIEQLRDVFKKLDKRVEIVIPPSSDIRRKDLYDFLVNLESASSNIKVIDQKEGSPQKTATFYIQNDLDKSSISFLGIPNGHEFSSLILAILNSAGLGRMPDEGIKKKIQSLKGPIRIRTFVSLTCENCPEVVQALNQMALIHPHFEHQMIDGAWAQDEIERLNIQGVPAVFIGDKLLSSGKTNLGELLSVLENELGVENDPQNVNKNHLGSFDVLVIGAGPAGSSAAIYSARKGLKTAIVAQNFGGQVKETKGIENFIGTKYTEGPQLASQLQAHVLEYPISIYEHRKVQKIESGEFRKTITLEGGEIIESKAIIVATGAKWRELNIPGEKEYLGRGVAFCPHCDGPFYKGKKVAVIGGGNSGVEAAIDLAGIVTEVILFEFNPELKADKVLVDKLKSLENVSIVTNAKTEEIIGDQTKVSSLAYTDRTENIRKQVNLDGVFVQIGLLPNTQFLKGVVDLTPFGEIVIDHKGKSSTPGIYGAGDATIVPYKQIIIAMGEGAKAALTAFEDLMIGPKH